MKIVAVTACIAGIAHTYMAKANLEKYSNKHNVEIKVETQGSMGVENRISQAEVDEADLVIFAVDTNVVDRDRFDGKEIIKVSTTDVVKHGEDIILDAIKKIEKGE